MALFAFAAAAHLLQGAALLRLTPFAPLGWPHDLHLWLLQSAALVAGAWMWLLPQRHGRGTAGGDPVRQLVGGLLLAQAVFAIIFWLTRNMGVDRLGWVRAAFWLGGEFRLPALFATAQLALAATLAWACWQLERRWVWVFAAAVCAYMAVDELFSLHERVGNALRASGRIESSGPRTVALGSVQVYAWTLVFGPLALIVGGALFAGFRAVLPPRQLGCLVLAAVVFVVGAVGFETRQSHALVLERHQVHSTASHFNLLVEETLETLGVTLAVAVFARRRWPRK